MQIGRRGLFQMLAAAVASARALPAKIVSARPGEALVDRLMEECLPGSLVTIPGWRIMWTGWKVSQNSIDEAMQWVAFPLKRNGDYDQKRQCIYTSAPGYAGFLRRGECFCLDAHWPQAVGMDLIEQSDTEHREAIKRAEQRVSCKLLLEWLQANGKPEWSKMSPETRFYTDASRYTKEATGHNLDGYPVPRVACEFALKCRRDLLGFGDSKMRWWGEA